MELLKDYDLLILYHPRKLNVVADALSRKVPTEDSMVGLVNEQGHFIARGSKCRGNTNSDFGSRGEEVAQKVDPLCESAME